MRVTVPRHLLTAVMAIVIFHGVVGAEVRCNTAEARPSLASLEAEIAELRAEQFQVFDADGMHISPSPAGEATPLFLDVSGTTVIVPVDPPSGSLEVDHVSLVFEEPQCGGTPFTESSRIGRLLANGPAPATRYFVPAAEPRRSITVRTQLLDTGLCLAVAHHEAGVVTIRELALADLGLDFPLPAPLFVAPFAP